jgi:hypothetical protein
LQIFNFFWYMGKFFVQNILPYVLLIIICISFMIKFVQKLKLLDLTRKKLYEQNKNLKLQDFISSMKEMRLTLAFICAFFIVLKIADYIYFCDNFIFQVIFYINLTIILSLLLATMTNESFWASSRNHRENEEKVAKFAIDFLAVLAGSVMMMEIGNVFLRVLI